MASCSPVGVVGLIPARAGNTRVVRLRPALSGAHPRSRGEHNVSGVDKPNGWGSSPLARGTRLGCKVSGGSFGLIPARAGNTARAKGDKSENGAHPRSRGEHSIAPVFDTVRVGSSPLARGTRSQPVPDGITHGLIPARAGNTGTGRGSSGGCGGSSPLARGTLAGKGFGVSRPGLIPARAGNTAWFLRITKSGGAHPRSRGEHACKNLRTPSRLGSSPLARGTLVPGNHLVDGVGLIPARAGNTFATVGVGSGARAHPRSRGEHCQSRQLWQLAMGSSPLARGTQPRG